MSTIPPLTPGGPPLPVAIVDQQAPTNGGPADALYHLVAILSVVVSATVLAALRVITPETVGVVYGSALGYSGGVSVRRRQSDYRPASRSTD